MFIYCNDDDNSVMCSLLASIMTVKCSLIFNTVSFFLSFFLCII